MTLIAEVLWNFSGYLLGCVVWFAMFPVVWILTVTVALVVGLFLPGGYRDAVSKLVSEGHRFWADWGVLIIS